MTHLGDNVAAFVDGQLSPEATRVVESHLDDCEACRQAVRQQRLLKSRMRGVGHPAPPPGLLASLSTLPQDPPPRPGLWSRFGAGLVLLGASMAVVAVAYMVGPAEAEADEIAPPFDEFAAEHTGGGTTVGSLTVSALVELDEYGWPCRGRLGSFERVSGQYRNGQETLALVYSDGLDTLSLYEQNGTLDPQAVEEFERQQVAERHVWVRDGRPRVVTWHADGVVYTIVTDLGDRRLGPAITDLPRPADEPDAAERVGDGLTRMTAWLSAA